MNNIKKCYIYGYVCWNGCLSCKKGNVAIKEGTESRSTNSEETGGNKRDANLQIVAIKMENSFFFPPQNLAFLFRVFVPF